MSAASKYKVEKLIELGADGFLEKPFKNDSLKALIEMHLNSNLGPTLKKTA